MRALAVVTLSVLAAALLAGCTPDPDMQMESKSPVQSNPRVTVTRIGIFGDQLAYHERRGIYVIQDAKTGKEFIGVSGIGITEVGSHSQGKTTAQDER
jgi:hypothetical protein